MSSNSPLSRRRLLATAVGGAIVASTGALGLSPAAGRAHLTGCRSTSTACVSGPGQAPGMGPSPPWRRAQLSKHLNGSVVPMGTTGSRSRWNPPARSGMSPHSSWRRSPTPSGRRCRFRPAAAAGPLGSPAWPAPCSARCRPAARGYVTTEMPVTKDGYVWINVVFNSHGLSGWVAKNFLTWI